MLEAELADGKMPLHMCVGLACRELPADLKAGFRTIKICFVH